MLDCPSLVGRSRQLEPPPPPTYRSSPCTVHLKYAYLLTPAGLAEKAALTGRFLKRKMAEYEALKAEIEALQADHPEHTL